MACIPCGTSSHHQKRKKGGVTQRSSWWLVVDAQLTSVLGLTAGTLVADVDKIGVGGALCKGRQGGYTATWDTSVLFASLGGLLL